MPTVFTAQTIAEKALQIIGAYTSNMAQADDAELQRSLEFLEMMLAQEATTGPLSGMWETDEFYVTADQEEYSIDSVTDANGCEALFSACIFQALNGTVINDLKIITEDEYNLLDKEETGVPTHIYMSKNVSFPNFYLWPKLPTDTSNTEYKARIRYQTFPMADLNTGGFNTENVIRLRQGWYLWASTALAYIIGRGSVRRLDENELNRLEKDTDKYRVKLESFGGQERHDLSDNVQPLEDYR